MVQEDFELQVDGRTVPGVLLLPDQRSARVPLVLAQHGGSSHKLGQEILDWAAVFVAKQDRKSVV